ncbi:thiamine phosphate synthase [Carnobacterium gallinarum]|uniref:thiamine phosphate synthase n=1 Tax=Carnobacterium gallinarum TaxID=2749 RepID=UPI001FDF1885|nr:thiamine phosphate synthase [Carnobacterium gallinarum]
MVQQIIGRTTKGMDWMVNQSKEMMGKMLTVYFIAGTQDIVEGTLPECLEQALEAGITCFQYREKGRGSLATYEERKAMALICQKLCQDYQVPLIINDDLKLALEIGADGIHVGQNDVRIQEIIKLSEPTMLIGLSCHSENEVSAANQLLEVDYYGIGPVYQTTSKVDAEPAIGVSKLGELTRIAEKPVVAIGGIQLGNAKEIDSPVGVAVISAITQAENILEVVEKLVMRS